MKCKLQKSSSLSFYPVLIFLLIILSGCRSSGKRTEDPLFNKALENGYLANKGYQRCIDFVEDWLKFADPETGLIPRNLDSSIDVWEPKDSGADNYPFMVLTAAIIDNELFEGPMYDILLAEQKYTNRLGRLPDRYSFSKQDFTIEEPDTDRIIFGAAEYVKDGLLALTEYLGHSPWSDRMIDIVDDIWEYAPYDTPYGKIPSLNVEVNGELLQTLSRLYWMTGNENYLEQAVRIGDYYLLGNQHPTRDMDLIRLRDHGCEIVSGLCEIYVTVAFANQAKKAEYQEHIYEMLDRILEVGTNEDGLFYNQVNPLTGEILDDGIADTWGYTYNAYYSVYMLDNHEPYKDALLKVFTNLSNYVNYDWERGSADGYADAVESALNLYNREPLPDVAGWIDSEIQVMWSMQDSPQREGLEKWQDRGVIEGWHGDGNFARTTIMYCLWKTQGITMSPWGNSLIYGAERDNDVIRIAVHTGDNWSGKMHFDHPRHMDIFNLPMDYPRINQFPEWFTAERERKYTITNLNNEETVEYTGQQLIDGIRLEVHSGDTTYLELKPKW